MTTLMRIFEAFYGLHGVTPDLRLEKMSSEYRAQAHCGDRLATGRWVGSPELALETLRDCLVQTIDLEREKHEARAAVLRKAGGLDEPDPQVRAEQHAAMFVEAVERAAAERF